MIGTQFFKIADEGRTRSSKVVIICLSLLLMGLIAIVDYLTGREIHLGIFYFLPIWLITWNFGLRGGLLVSLGCAVLWFLIDNLSEYSYSRPFIPYWNATARLGYFVTFPY
jgi:glucose-6-phosphate-specific signal transduction histidine kinase